MNSNKLILFLLPFVVCLVVIFLYGNYRCKNPEYKDILETKSGLQYRIVRKGEGKSPDSSSDQVRVNYEGKLVDGTIFDSSYEKGEPFVTRLNRVIKGWTEGIQLMNEGSEYEFFIHPRLAYGPRPNNNIPANSVLIFKVELQKVFEKNIK